ncbi:MAG: amidohydrolase family protein [Clostridiales Family XIII bacterium]|jgi:enamidase|nr:amidohydrolase family protein [Clostridiales Family XIII bacterium]
MKIAVKNIGTLVTGDIARPLSDATTILIEDGKIAQVGGEALLAGGGFAQTIDAAGATVAPGLIDSHVHPVLGDFSPRQSILGYIGSSLHGGVTTMISAGEPHTPGRPKDVAGTKALAVLAHKSAANARPGGVKLHGGALILEKGLKEEDFAELAATGVWLVGEVGLGSVKDPLEAAEMLGWARKYGMKSCMHTGGTSIPGSSTVPAADVIAAGPDVVSHINGGPTAVPIEEADKLIDGTDLTLEIVQCGNNKVMLHVASRLKEKGALGRLIVGNDSPSGTGIIPLGVLRTLATVASLGGVSAAEAICCATGNTARAYGLPVGFIKEGCEADLVFMDTPLGSVGADALGALEAGDLPGISMVLVDGKQAAGVSRNTPPALRKAALAEPA